MEANWNGLNSTTLSHSPTRTASLKGRLWVPGLHGTLGSPQCGSRVRSFFSHSCRAVGSAICFLVAFTWILTPKTVFSTSQALNKTFVVGGMKKGRQDKLSLGQHNEWMAPVIHVSPTPQSSEILYRLSNFVLISWQIKLFINICDSCNYNIWSDRLCCWYEFFQPTNDQIISHWI